MSGRRDEIRRRITEVVEKFREKGALSPEKAMTIQELNLPPRFEEAMHRRLGQTGIFVEVDGKYYLNEERLRQIQEQRAKKGVGSSGSNGWGKPQSPNWSRVGGLLLMLPIGLIIALVLFYFLSSSGGYFPGEFLIVIVVILIGLTVVRLLFWRSRRRYWRNARNEMAQVRLM
jgi:hypothetical protein